ncbi:hypothetical protein FACS189434_04350 [Bacteroidia bacterium]|nr:hypothetical protein FACS189434_04350 [Bacteroidia bacterium]
MQKLFIAILSFISIVSYSQTIDLRNDCGIVHTDVADGVIDEVIGTAQLINLGLEIVTDKDKAKEIWASVKKINLSTIKNAAIGAIKDKWDKYANSPDYVTYPS